MAAGVPAPDLRNGVKTYALARPRQRFSLPPHFVLLAAAYSVHAGGEQFVTCKVRTEGDDAADESGGGKSAVSEVLVAVRCLEQLRPARVTLKTALVGRFFHQAENVHSARVLPFHPPCARHDVLLSRAKFDACFRDVIRSKQKFNSDHGRYFTLQLLLAVRALHAANVVLGHLTPWDLSVTADCHLVVSDCSRAAPAYGTVDADAVRAVSADDADDDDGPLFLDTAHKWYVAPEALLKFRDAHAPPADVWSVGIILAECFTRRPLLPGKEVIDQVERIRSTMGGLPPSTDCMGPAVRAFLKRNPRLGETEPDRLLQRIAELSDDPRTLALDPEGLDLLRSLLQPDPAKRPSAGAALRHPWFASLVEDDDIAAAVHASAPARSFPWERYVAAARDLQSIRTALVTEGRRRAPRLLQRRGGTEPAAASAAAAAPPA